MCGKGILEGLNRCCYMHVSGMNVSFYHHEKKVLNAGEKVILFCILT